MEETLNPNERIGTLSWSYGLAGDKEGGAGAWRFAHIGIDFDADVRAALDDWLITDDHRDRDYGDRPNWGDFVMWCPESTLARHGLRLLDNSSAGRMTVNHDESFEIAERQFITITVVVRAGDVDSTDIDPAALRSLISDDNSMFFTIESGVSDVAMAAGADPAGW